MHHDAEALAARNALIVAIANQEAPELERFRVNSGISFPILVDENAELIARYGFTNEERPSLPHPATLVLDEEGVVVYRRVDVDYRERPEVSDLLRALDAR